NPRPAMFDLFAAGLAVALAALAVHALAALDAGVPAALDSAARVIAYVLLPGWAAARWLPGQARRRAWETVLAVGLGAALAGAAGALARAGSWPADRPLLALAVVSLALLAPRPGISQHAAPAETREETRPMIAPAPSGSAQPGTRQ